MRTLSSMHIQRIQAKLSLSEPGCIHNVVGLPRNRSCCWGCMRHHNHLSTMQQSVGSNVQCCASLGQQSPMVQSSTAKVPHDSFPALCMHAHVLHADSRCAAAGRLHTQPEHNVMDKPICNAGCVMLCACKLGAKGCNMTPLCQQQLGSAATLKQAS